MIITRSGSAITEIHHEPPDTPGNGGGRETSVERLVRNITDDTERVRAAVTGSRGLIRVADGGERRVECDVAMVVTDRRVAFAEATAGAPATDAGAIAYGDLAAVEVDDGRLVLSLAEGVRWAFPLPETDADVIDDIVRHLRWVGEVRGRVLACRNDLELAAGRIREAAADRNWDEATDAYRRIRDRLDGLIGAVQWTDPIDDDVLAPELTGMERTLERAYARLFIERAESQLALGSQLVDTEDYDRAGKVLGQAREYYERARDRADAVERPDAFRFGEQRDLRDDLDRLAWELDTVAAEPLRQAHEARIRAVDTDDPAEAVDHWEAAFRRYGSVLALGPDGECLAGDLDEIRAELDRAADRLVSRHRELATDSWDHGVDLEAEGDIEAAIRTCETATDHLERAHELAVAFRPDDAADIEDRLDRMTHAVEGMREALDGGSADDGTAPPEGSAGAAPSLADIDTHHEITMETTVEGDGVAPADADADVPDDPDSESAGGADGETVAGAEPVDAE